MEKLFSYGTLQLKNVQQETFGRLLIGTKEIHPILKFTGKLEDKVEGTIFEITAEELQQADDYEVEEYVRVKAKFHSGVEAWIYADANEK